MKTSVTAKTKSGLRTVDVLFSAFPDGDSYCQIADDKHVRGNDVIISHDLYPMQNNRIVQLILLVDLLQDLGARSVSVFVPYLPYARQDKRHFSGEAVSAQTLGRLLQRAGVRTLYTFDCHFLKGDRHAIYEGLEICNLTLGPVLLEHFRQHIGHDRYEVVGPDKGSNYLVRDYGSQHMHKERGDYDMGEAVRHRAVKKLEHGNLKLSHDAVVIIDDMISTGGTILKAVQNLKELKKDIYCLAVHGLFLNGSDQKLTSQAKGVWVSDTLPHENSIPIVGKAWQEGIIPAWLEYCDSPATPLQSGKL